MASRAEIVAVFSLEYLSDVTSPTQMVANVNSGSHSATAEHVAIQTTVHNISGTSPTLTISLEGSYDGKAWEGAGVSLTFANPPTATQKSDAVATGYGFVRLRAVISTSDQSGRVLFSSTLVFTHQDN